MLPTPPPVGPAPVLDQPTTVVDRAPIALGTGVRIAILLIMLGLLLGALAVVPALAAPGGAAVCLVCPGS